MDFHYLPTCTNLLFNCPILLFAHLLLFIYVDTTSRLLPRQMGRFHCYVVYRGRQSGIYQTWTECKAQVLGYPNAEFKGFSSIEEARVSFLNYHGQAKLIQNLQVCFHRRRVEDRSGIQFEERLFFVLLLASLFSYAFCGASLSIFICFLIRVHLVCLHILYACYYAGPIHVNFIVLLCSAVAH